MNLFKLLSLIETVPVYRDLVNEFRNRTETRRKLVLYDSVKPYFISALARSLHIPLLVVTPQPENARKLYEEVSYWCQNPDLVYLYPETDLLSGSRASTELATFVERLKIITVAATAGGTSNEDGLPIIISSTPAVSSKIIPRDEFIAACHVLEVGAEVSPRELVERWQNIGYGIESMVELPGTISRRGGIVDIYPVNGELPVRLEFSGNTIESIRSFDTRTQRSLELLDSVFIVPALEGSFTSDETTIIDYVSDNFMLVLDDPDGIKNVIDMLNTQVHEIGIRENSRNGTVPETGIPLVTQEKYMAKIGEIKQCISFIPWGEINGDNHNVSFPVTSIPKYGGRIDAFSRYLKQRLKEDRRIVIFSQQIERLLELLQEYGVAVNNIDALVEVPPAHTVTLLRDSMTEGWELSNTLIVITDNEIFGVVKKRRSFSKRPIRHHKLVAELTNGDYVVHIDHGIGIFKGLSFKEVDGIGKEYLVLEYAAADRLYVPTDQVDRVSRYIGSSDQVPRLSRLGTQEWVQVKERIKKSIADIAEELLKLYATRELVTGFAYSSDGTWQRELESSFPYVETPDQIAAIETVKYDMEMKKPMDRLICGDVGYGKTEVALRAAFKAVMDNKQVAVLVPTTVLAQQHYITFKERLQAFPVRVEVLSRFCSKQEQATILEGLAAGTVDICIGTHRLLQKDVVFKDLGLLIIDEEQRFGVNSKEHFKKLRKEIDVLTLSATPIPRTLHMALSGVRDLSTMEIPPENRLPVEIHVGAYDKRLVHEAIVRELERNGQAFFVHNRIRNIREVADALKKLIPEAIISVAHGRMPEEELERVMVDFISHKSDVLITTTIIESGLDMPNVNTLIVDESDKLGLTQLYQLRGRIGRGVNNAYAYFLYDMGKHLTEQSRKRLKTISQTTDLGAGFTIAMKDLEIRGAGNLLGVEQSGYIAAVGYDLYCHLLSQAIDTIRQKQAGIIAPVINLHNVPSIDLPVTAYIPEDYIVSPDIRISFYRKLAMVQRVEQIEDMAADLKDRFGGLPQPVVDLLYYVEIKLLTASTDIESISSKHGQIIISFYKDVNLSGLDISRYRQLSEIQIGRKKIRITIDQSKGNWQSILKQVIESITLDENMSHIGNS
jgi:transcription-repair coupling factor (superfamily II helicase)